MPPRPPRSPAPIAAPAPGGPRAPEAPAGASGAPRPPPFFARPPLAAWLVALFAAALHLYPLARAVWTAPQGYEVTGNLSGSPDFLQYRVWERRAQVTGPLVDNRFTTEPHEPYLPVLFYWAVGATARLAGTTPEWTYALAGAPLAFALALLLYLVARHALVRPGPTWWVFLATLLGGGLGAHLKLLGERGAGEHALLAPLVSSFETAPVWESYRSHYAFRVLFDTHFLVVWLVTIAALLAFRFALERPSAARIGLTALLSAAITVLHVYEGPLLIAIFVCTALLCRSKGIARGAAVRAALAGCAAVAATLAGLRWLYARGGLPHPPWDPPDVFFANLVLAYPVAWLVIATGLVAYWRRAGVLELFLLGWALGCTALTLSSPYYPYAGRGPTTLQVPLYAIAGGIYFARRARVPLHHALLALLLLGVTPLRDLHRMWWTSRFRPGVPVQFLSREQRAMVDALAQRATERDVLLAEPFEYRWLAPEHPGISYHGHFFLTVDFDRKRAAVERFYAELGDAERAEFLRERGVRFVHVARERDPDAFARLPGLRELARADGGALFEVVGPGDGGER